MRLHPKTDQITTMKNYSVPENKFKPHDYTRQNFLTHRFMEGMDGLNIFGLVMHTK